MAFGIQGLRASIIAAAALLLCAIHIAPAAAADHIRLAIQKTGTLAWELAIIKEHKLDEKYGLVLDVTSMASNDAGKLALQGHTADMIVSDWLWVARERSLGDNLVYYPYSSAIGGVVVPANSPIKTVADLKGKKIAVAGGPIDKSWLLLRALALRDGVDLKSQSQINYGAPPLLSAKALQGEFDATLTNWNFVADLESKGMHTVIEMDDVVKQLGASGPISSIGYAFDEQWAMQNRSAVDRYFAMSKEAKEILGSSPDEWKQLAPLIGVSDPATLELYRARYTAGIPSRPIADEEKDATAMYKILADLGGTDLVGPAKELAPGTFYHPASTGG